jgi:hypothetical protein
MILLYLFVKGMRGIVWCLGWMVWACLALAGVMLVLTFGSLAVCLGEHGAVTRGLRAIRPPDYLLPRPSRK